MAMPYSLHFSITRSSRMEPPGSAMQVTPLLWARSMLSGKGKKAEREKEMQKAPSEHAEKYPMPPKYELALEEGNGETAKRLLALLASGEKSRSELAAELGVSSQPWLSASYLNPLMEQGYIAQTLPQKPKSPLQRYRILRKGREVLA